MNRHQHDAYVLPTGHRDWFEVTQRVLYQIKRLVVYRVHRVHIPVAGGIRFRQHDMAIRVSTSGDTL